MTGPLELLVTGGRVARCTADDLAVIEHGAVGVAGGRVAFVGPAVDAPSAARVIDAGDHVVLPGLVDPHTHLVFGGSRVDEFARRMAGEDYRTIAAEGGGIARTVRGTRAASDDELYTLAAARARAMVRHGVTSVEVKSGYGLTLEDELRMLRVARRLHEDGVVRVTTSFLGAHAVPPERRDDRDGYVDELVDRMIPAVAGEGLADACDVYCDDGAFTLDEARRILTAAADAGLRVRGHVGQFEDLGGAELLAELGALSADHLEELSDDGARALGRAGVVGVLLPGAWRTLRQSPPDVSRLRAAGVGLAVGTDLNPGTSPCVDLPLCAALAVRDAGLTLEEAVLAVTREAARAAGIDGAGVIREGAHADLSIYPQGDPRAVAYALGGTRATTVILGGRVIHEGGASDVPVW